MSRSTRSTRSDRALGSAPLLAVLLLPVACDPGEQIDPIVGSWRSIDLIAGDRNELELEDDLEGDALLHFYYGEDLYFAEFDVVAEPQGGGEYELELECRGDCSDLDFTAECELRDDELECDGEGAWSEYVLRWERD